MATPEAQLNRKFETTLLVHLDLHGAMSAAKLAKEVEAVAAGFISASSAKYSSAADAVSRTLRRIKSNCSPSGEIELFEMRFVVNYSHKTRTWSAKIVHG